MSKRHPVKVAGEVIGHVYKFDSPMGDGWHWQFADEDLHTGTCWSKQAAVHRLKEAHAEREARRAAKTLLGEILEKVFKAEDLVRVGRAPKCPECRDVYLVPVSRRNDANWVQTGWRCAQCLKDQGLLN